MFKHFKSFGKQILTYGLGDTINKIIGILIVPLFTRYLTPADYGVAGILAIMSALIIGICDLGLSNGMARFYHEEREPDRTKLFSTSQVAMVLFSLALALLAWPFSQTLSQFFFRSPDYGYILMLNLFAIPMTMAVTAPFMRLRLENNARTYTSFNVARAITGLALNVFFLVFLKRGIIGLFEAPLINAGIYALILGIYNLRYGLSFSWSLFKKMFVFASPFILGLMAFWVMDWVDRLLLTRMTNLSEVGLYSLGYAMGMSIMLPVGAFSTAWVPFYLSVSKQENAQKIYSLIFTYYSLVIGFFVLLIAIFSRDYFAFFTPSEYHSAYIVAPLVALAYALKGNFTITAVGAFLKKKTILELVSDTIAMLLNIGFMFLLIPYFGRIGAAWATFAAYLALPISMYLLSRKIFPIKYEIGRILQITIIGLAIYFICNFIYQPTLSNLILRLLIVMIYPIVFFLTGFFKEEEMARFRALKVKLFRKSVQYEPENLQ